jgi:putative protease
MEMAFSRGLHTGWFGGTNNQQLVHARFGKKRGVYLGEVARVLRDGVLIRLEGPLKPGDGVVFDAGKPEENEEGGRIYEIEAQRGEKLTELRFGHGDINFSRVHVGDKLWKTSDPELDRRLRQSFEGDAPKFQRPIEIEVHGSPANRSRSLRTMNSEMSPKSNPPCRWRKPKSSRSRPKNCASSLAASAARRSSSAN